MPKREKYRFSIKGKPLYPHIKITAGPFPRILATRLIDDDGSEYFGAFLNRTNARILLDLVNRTFRLRSCEIDIDGSFNYPCTMYYKRRCLGPCVSGLIDEAEYNGVVTLVRLFLRNDRELLRETLAARIDSAAGELDFEAAARWRDMLGTIEGFWANKRISAWADEVSDTFHVRISHAGVDVFLISQKSRRVVGERVFSFPDASAADADEVLADVIGQFYRFHAPKEIRVSLDPDRRKGIAERLGRRFGRSVRVVPLTEKNRKISTEVAVYRSTTELDMNRSIAASSPGKLAAELKALFRLNRSPKRVSAIDVSHISGTDQVAAAIAWENGRTVADAAEYLLADDMSEPDALAEIVARRYREPSSELVLIDGGRSQLSAALGAVPAGAGPVFIAAVKPPGRHSEISHFLTADGKQVDFDPTSPAMLLLQRLRDEVHDFANAVHRETRDFAAFYELANILPSLTEPERQKLLRHFGSQARLLNATSDELAEVIGDRAERAFHDAEAYKSGRGSRIRPLIVPVRLQDENGAAEDLRPIEAPLGKARTLK